MRMNQHQHDICALTYGILTATPISLIYTDRDGVTSHRIVVPLSIERAQNSHGIVRVYDLQRTAPRTFAIERIWDVRRA